MRAGTGKRGGARPGAGRRKRREAGWVVVARKEGLTVTDLVRRLYLQRGLSLLHISRVLELSLEEVERHWKEGRAMQLEQAPKTAGDFTALREQISLALWQTVELTYAEGTFVQEPKVAGVTDGDEKKEEEAVVPKAPMLGVRLRALKQLCELYGLGADGLAQKGETSAGYSTPEEIAGRVRDWLAREGKVGVEGEVYGG